jgi:DMSO/TMAO reductase YedYZ heme-binding membrane subunit
MVGAIGGTAYLLMYLMVITSFDAPRRFLSPAAWKRLHKLGLYYNGFLFLAMLPPGADEELPDAGRVLLIVLTTLALLVRVAAAVSRWRNSSTINRGAGR